MIAKFYRDEAGLELSEYAMAAALITLAVVSAIGFLGGNISTVIANLASFLK